MNLGKLTNIVQCVIKSRKDKTNKITQLAMAINGTYVEDTTYVDDKIRWIFDENEGGFSVQHSNISKAVEKINSLKSENVVLLLTEKQASKFSILAGLTGVTILDLSRKDAYDTYAPHLATFGVDMTGVVLVVSFVIGELDNNTKFTYNGVEYTLLPAEEEPVVTAPMFDSVDLTGETFSSSQFRLGDNIIYNATDNSLISPYVIFLTAEQYSKFQITGTFVDNEAQQTFENEVLSASLAPVSDLSESPFTIPQNAAYACLLSNVVVEAIGSAQATSITVTYDGIDYVYNDTNVQITLPEEEPEVDTLYSVDCQSVNNGTLVTSSFNLGDNITAANEGGDLSVSPYALLLTSEQAQNFSISVTGATGANQEDVDGVAATLQLMAYDSSGLEENATISQFATEHNITHICMITSLVDYLHVIGTEYEVISSATITYNGHTYVYDQSKVAVINNETEQQGE